MFVVGDRGFGKTTLLLNLWASDARRVAAADDENQRTMIWLETKGEGAEQAAAVARANGVEPVVIEASTISGGRLELVNWDKPTQSAEVLGEAMKYALEAGDVRAASAAVIAAAFTAVIGATPEQCVELGYSTGVPNVMDLAFRMLNGAPQERSADLVRDVLCENESFRGMDRYMSMKAFDRNRIFEAPITKFGLFRKAVGLFDGTDRDVLTLPDLLVNHRVVVINLGSTQHGEGYSSELAERMSALVTYVLWDEIQRCCDGWQKQGRSVALYSDEVADLASESPHVVDVVELMGDQGRSRGLVQVLATQKATKLPKGTMDALESFGNRAYFRVNNVDTAKRGAEELNEGLHR